MNIEKIIKNLENLAKPKAIAYTGGMTTEIGPIYQIFLRNFTHEGTFTAAVPRLAGIAAMGFSHICLTPVHPIGKAARKGNLGSPYAISDYRAIDPALGTIEDFKAFLDAAHSLGLKVMMDVVYNHTSPDSALAKEHPDWFLGGAEPMTEAVAAAPGNAFNPRGRVARKCADWSDVIDLDYGSSPQLWMELMSILVLWREMGVDGFRCDVASLVPVDFWKQARQRVNQYDPGTRKDKYPLLWLAESVHPKFLKQIRDSGFGAWSEPELHSVFDLSYDYDGWERMEEVWAGWRPARDYFEYLYIQETLYPRGARKLRFLENHDQPRSAARFTTPEALRAWTALSHFIPGRAFVYMGQELGIRHKPELFEKDPVDWSSGDLEFSGFFAASLAACEEAKREAPFFSWREIAEDVFLCERAASATASVPKYAALVALGSPKAGDGSGRPIRLEKPLKGMDFLSRKPVELVDGMPLPKNPIILKIIA
jgi:glycosidase